MVVVRTTKVNYSELSEVANPYNETLNNPQVTGEVNIDSLSGLISLAQEISIQAGMIGYLNSFLLYAFGALLPIPILFMLRIKRQSPAAG
jgi:VIT1/CCC1 family predicted Fe2+/Mn2+ transporter